MPLPILLVVGGIACAVSVAAVLLLWARIVHFLLNVLVPWVRNTLGNGTADLFSTLISWFDKAIVPPFTVLQSGWRFFTYGIWSIRTWFTKSEGKSAKAWTETVMSTGVRTVTEEVIDYKDLPAEVRDALLAPAAAPVELDLKGAIRKRMEERAYEDGIPLAYLG